MPRDGEERLPRLHRLSWEACRRRPLARPCRSPAYMCSLRANVAPSSAAADTGRSSGGAVGALHTSDGAVASRTSHPLENPHWTGIRGRLLQNPTDSTRRRLLSRRPRISDPRASKTGSASPGRTTASPTLTAGQSLQSVRFSAGLAYRLLRLFRALIEHPQPAVSSPPPAPSSPVASERPYPANVRCEVHDAPPGSWEKLRGRLTAYRREISSRCAHTSITRRTRHIFFSWGFRHVWQSPQR